MPDSDDYKAEIERLVAELQSEAKLAAADARALALQYGPLVFRWQAEAVAVAETDPAVAKKRRASIKHVRHAAVLDLAGRGVNVTNKVERAVLAAFETALGAAIGASLPASQPSTPPAEPHGEYPPDDSDPHEEGETHL